MRRVVLGCWAGLGNEVGLCLVGAIIVRALVNKLQVTGKSNQRQEVHYRGLLDQLIPSSLNDSDLRQYYL